MVSNGAYDLTAGYAWTRLVAAPAGTSTAYAMFTIVVDSSNHYRIWESNGTIGFEKKINNVKSATTMTFDAVAHAFWRIRHDAASSNIVFETAPSNGGLPGTWTTRRTVARELSVTAMRLELKAGSTDPQSVSPGTVRFDDVRAAR
ncbi:MAG: hypothetical protein DMG01_30270 [Acidobacteria bacterium]|nr:MAG: hypothetical protein DMG01_30270 [Acidobacteriota bacterium]